MERMQRRAVSGSQVDNGTATLFDEGLPIWLAVVL